MSLPTGALGLLGLGLGAASTAADSYAAYQEQRTQRIQAEYNAQTLDNNASLMDIRADQQIARGEFNASLAAIEGRNKIERQRSGYAASGVKVDSGTALDVVAEQAGWNRLEQDVITYDAELAAWETRNDAANLRQQAAMTRAGVGNPGWAAATSLLAGGTSLYNQYRQYQMFDKA